MHAIVDVPPLHDAVQRIREERVRAVTGPRGAASLVRGDQVRRAHTVVPGAPGRWSPFAHGRDGVLVEATAAEGVRIGGRVVDGDAVLFAHPGDGPTVARFPGGAEGVLVSEDRRTFSLQVWDPAGAARRGIAGIGAYPVDPTWSVDARVLPAARGVDAPAHAEVVFERHGALHRLAADTGPEADELLVHFTDATSGGETAGAGRTVRLVRVGADRVRIDFNLAALLPCSFSPAWHRPLPPTGNHLPVPVRAGERMAVDADGAPVG